MSQSLAQGLTGSGGSISRIEQCQLVSPAPSLRQEGRHSPMLCLAVFMTHSFPAEKGSFRTTLEVSQQNYWAIGGLQPPQLYAPLFYYLLPLFLFLAHFSSSISSLSPFQDPRPFCASATNIGVFPQASHILSWSSGLC